MSFFERLLRKSIFESQRFGRRFDVGFREQIYHENYMALCANLSWIKRPVLPSPAGGTANSSMLYMLLSVLMEESPSNIVELGIGKTTMLLSQYAASHEGVSVSSIDHDAFWLGVVKNEVNEQLQLLHYPLVQLGGWPGKRLWYNITEFPKENIELLIIDGPPAYSKNSRYDRMGIMDFVPDILAKEFIVIVDDASRIGESLLVNRMQEKMPPNVRHRQVYGMSTQSIFATERYFKFLYL